MLRSSLQFSIALIMGGCTSSLTLDAGTLTGPAGDAPVAAMMAEPAGVSADAADHAVAVLYNAAGQEIGSARFTEDATGRVHVNIHASGLTPGLHGVHLHAVGTCNGSTATPFSSAGGHYNPTARKHGHHNPDGFHSGDLPNLEAGPSGVARLTVTLQQFRLAELFDGDGTAVVVHANEDDQVTDSGPAGPGNSGARIGCGVISR